VSLLKSPRGRTTLGVLAASLALVVACFGATEVRLVLSTDLSCTAAGASGAPRSLSARIYLGQAMAGAGVASTEHCAAGSSGVVSELGDLVITPSGARDAKFTVTVVLAVDKDPDACFPPGSPDRCIFARRAVSFSEHQTRSLTIGLDQDCIGVACDPGSSCYAGQCISVSLFCDDPAQCQPTLDGGAPADAASETTLDAASDAPPEAGFDAGPPTVIASGRTAVASVAADASGLYWSEPGGYAQANGGIYFRADPGSPTQTLASGRESPSMISIDATTVYWMELLGEGIIRVAKSGGTASVFVPTGAGALGVNALYVLVDPTYVFWNNEAEGAVRGTLTRILKDGTQRTTLTTMAEGPWAVAEDAQSLVWVSGPQTGGVGTISSIPKIGGATSVLSAAETSETTARIAAANGNVAWASTASGGSLVIRAAGRPSVTVATGQGATTSIAADDQAVYWLHVTGGAGTGALEKATWAGAVVTLRSGIQAAGTVALDATSVYFVDNHDSSGLVATAEILRLPK
jgi:hypothetical protein